MIKLFLFIHLFVFSFSTWAMSVQQAFYQFYDSDKISSRHCGKNTQHFLQFLYENKVKFNSGYVVSLHEDYARLNHFDDRWGSTERYADGENYSRANYYFHVFAVIDGIAYDFTQAGKKTQALKDYLFTAYIPKKKTQNIFFQGVVTPEKGIHNMLNLEMNVYDLEEYRKRLGPAAYTGTSIELFNYSLDKMVFQHPLERDKFSTSYDRMIQNSDGSVTITYPKANKGDGYIPLKAEANKACRAFGFMGARSDKTKHEVSDDKEMYQVYSSILPKDPYVLSSSDITISFKSSKTVGSVSNQPLLHYASSITCTDFANYIQSI